MSRRTLASLLIIALAVPAALSLTGCSRRNAMQTQVEKVSSQPDTSAVTPLERGQIRREVLQLTKKGLDAFVSDDIDAMASIFTTDQVTFYRKLKDDNSKAGKVRVRKHSDVKLDVVDMDKAGTEAVVRYLFKNDSYTADTSGAKLTEPTGKESEIDITVQRRNGTWTIVRMIGGPETVQ